MSRAILRWLVAFALLLVALPALAANARLQLDTTELAVGQTGRLVIQVVDGRTRGAPQVQTPAGLDTRYYGSSQRYYLDNFSRTLVYAYEYRITARSEGTYPLGPFRLELADGSVVETNAVELRVVPRPPDVEGRSLRVDAGFEAAGVGEGEPARVWEGQVVVYTYRLVSQQPVLSVEWRLPEFEGLRAPQHGNADERTYFVDEPDGGQVTFVEGVVPLVATGTGRRDQVPAVAQVRVPQGRPDILGFRQYKAETVPSGPVSLEVRPLPKAPPGFSGLVGDFRIQAALDRQAAAVGESVEWRLDIVGDGTLEGWSPPEQQVEGASVYQNGADLGATLQDERYVARGTFRRTVVPTQEGTLRLPQLTVVTFSPTRGEFVTHRLDLPPIEVAAGRESGGGVESFSAGRTEPTISEQEAVDFRDIYRWGPSRRLRVDGVLPALSIVAAAPGMLVVFGLVGERLRRVREARRRARRKPDTPESLLRDLPADPSARLAGLDAALRLALARRQGVDVATLDRASAIESLPAPLAERVRAVATRTDRARFAGEPAQADLEAEIRAVVAELGRGGTP